MQEAFYPALLLILVTASLGIPIPEDVPLIAAGVLLRTHGPTATDPGIASWTGTIFVALVGIMSGDLVLYTTGKWFGPSIVTRRPFRLMISPARFEWVRAQFHRRGAWFCFFGRFFMGIRAMMCMTAGATRFPYWKFFLADFAGALLSVPFFILLGYFFAGMIPTLKAYLSGIQLVVVGVLTAGLVIAIVIYKVRRSRGRGVEPMPEPVAPSAPVGPTPSRAEEPPVASVVAPSGLTDPDPDATEEEEVGAGV